MRRDLASHERRELHDVQNLLLNMADAAVRGAVAVTRFCPLHDADKPAALDATQHVVPEQTPFNLPIARHSQSFAPQRDSRAVASFSKLGILVFITLVTVTLLDFATTSGARRGGDDAHVACERLKHACDSLFDGEPPQPACAFDGSGAPFVANARTIETFPGEDVDLTNPDLVVVLPACDVDVIRDPRVLSLLPSVALLTLCVVMPLGLFPANTNTIIVRKLLLWTPTVPLVLIQLVLRGIVISATLGRAIDTATATIRVIEAWGLLVQACVGTRISP